MTHCFFGQYLLREGVLTTVALERAVCRQKQSNILLGRLAVELGLLRPVQVTAILERQQQAPLRFGELAVAMGFLSPAELTVLLGRQAENHVYLGEALIAEGLLPQAAVVRQLDQYHAELRAHEAAFLESLHQTDSRGVLARVYEVVAAYFFRIGFAAKPVALLPSLPDDLVGERVFLQQRTREGVAYLGLILPETLLRQVAFPLREQGGETLDADRETAREVLYTLNYHVCERLRADGLRVRHGDALPALPSGPTQCMAMRLRTVFDDFVVTYCR